MKKADRKKEHFRNEWKYLISTSEKEVLNLRMKPLMKLDPHAENGGYLIRSLYFDDYWNSAYEEKESGVLMRKKYRIRIYNYSAESIKLERKKKFGSYIYKEDAPLTKDEVQKILSGEYEFLLKSPYNLCREFYTECMSNMMRPRTIVDYEREPWIMDEGTVRITFDTDVRAAVGSYDIFDSTLPALSVLEPGKLIMEVKFTEISMEIPDKMIDAQAENMVQDMARRMQSQGLSLDMYLKYTGMTVEQMKEQARPDAEKRIRTRLVLEAVAQAENIQISDEKVDEEVAKMAEAYKMEVDKLKSYMSESDIKQMKEDLAVQQAVDLLVAEAKLA